MYGKFMNCNGIFHTNSQPDGKFFTLLNRLWY